MLEDMEDESSLTLTSYEIYEVVYNGIPIYIGSGKQDQRHKHVKSGISHNPKINELFFNDPDNIVVQVLRTGLTKEESLEYEKEYIQAIHPQYNIVHTPRNKKVGKYWK